MAPFSSISDRLTQLPLSQKILLAAGGVILLGTVLGYFLLLPLWKESKVSSRRYHPGKSKIGTDYPNPGADHPVQTRAG